MVVQWFNFCHFDEMKMNWLLIFGWKFVPQLFKYNILRHFSGKRGNMYSDFIAKLHVYT